jgi:hypothetical protein
LNQPKLETRRLTAGLTPVARQQEKLKVSRGPPCSAALHSRFQNLMMNDQKSKKISMYVCIQLTLHPITASSWDQHTRTIRSKIRISQVTNPTIHTATIDAWELSLLLIKRLHSFFLYYNAYLDRFVHTFHHFGYIHNWALDGCCL